VVAPDLPHWVKDLVVLAVSGLPVVEMRLGIGLGVLRYHLHPFEVWLLSTGANLLVVAPVWFLLPHVENGLRRSARMGRWLDRLFARTRHETRRARALAEVGLLLIVVLVAVPFPLPGSGLYTALLVAYIVGLPLRKALPWLAVGIAVACLAITVEFAALGFALRQI